MPSKKKKYNARFPAGRIKKIMQTDEEVGKVAQAVPVIISRALEMFVESMLQKAQQITLARNAKTLSPSHLKQCILAESRFDFLKDLVKNIPDVSHSDEVLTSCSADNPVPVHSNELPDDRIPCPGTSSTYVQKSQTNKRDNGQSSDSGSDYEPPVKRNNSVIPEFRNLRFGNGKPQPTVNISENSAPVDARSLLLTPTTPGGTRLPNFYTETLKEDEENAQSSVIQKNPEYASASDLPGFGFYKQPETAENPSKLLKLHIDLTKSFQNTLPNTAPAATAASPLFKIDFSISSDGTVINNLPITPSPQTPKTQSSFAKNFQSSFKVLTKSQSLDGTDSSVPTPAQHKLQLRGNETKPSNSVGTTRKKSCSNEPPPLLPISPVIKISPSSTVTKVSNSSIQLDEDYDT